MSVRSLSFDVLRTKRKEENARLRESRAGDFRKGRVNSSAQTNDALARLLLLDELLEFTDERRDEQRAGAVAHGRRTKEEHAPA